jgi:hypothetical protein
MRNIALRTLTRVALDDFQERKALDTLALDLGARAREEQT